MAERSDELLVSGPIVSSRVTFIVRFRTRNTARVHPGVNDGFGASQTNRLEILRQYLGGNTKHLIVLSSVGSITPIAYRSALSIERPEHRDTPHQRGPNGIIEVMKAINKLIGYWKLHLCKPVEHRLTENIIGHEKLICEWPIQTPMNVGELFLVVSHFSVDLNKHQGLFSSFARFLSLLLVRSKLQRSVAGVVSCDAQTIGEYAQYDRGNYRTDRTNCRKRIPPNHTVAQTRGHTGAHSAPDLCQQAPVQKVKNNQTHIELPLRIGRHSATPSLRTEAAHE